MRGIISAFCVGRPSGSAVRHQRKVPWQHCMPHLEVMPPPADLQDQQHGQCGVYGPQLVAADCSSMTWEMP